MKLEDATERYPWLVEIIGSPEPDVEISIIEAEGWLCMDTMVQTATSFHYRSWNVSYDILRQFHFVTGQDIWKNVVPPTPVSESAEFPEVTLLDTLRRYIASGRCPRYIVSDEYLEAQWPDWRIDPTSAGPEFVEDRPVRLRRRIIIIIPVDPLAVEKLTEPCGKEVRCHAGLHDPL